MTPRPQRQASLCIGFLFAFLFFNSSWLAGNHFLSVPGSRKGPSPSSPSGLRRQARSEDTSALFHPRKPEQPERGKPRLRAAWHTAARPASQLASGPRPRRQRGEQTPEPAVPGGAEPVSAGSSRRAALPVMALEVRRPRARAASPPPRGAEGGRGAMARGKGGFVRSRLFLLGVF